MKNDLKRVAIVGAGASGLIAGCHAAASGNPVTLFEKQKKTGRKILITGNGRCNITNANIDVSRYHGSNPSFVHNVFSRFSHEDTVAFFLSAGIPFIEESQGRMFPASLQAQTVAGILEYEVSRRGVDVRLHRRVDAVEPGEKHFTVVTAGKEKHNFDSVILSCGSCAYPQLGASRSGYEIARSLGHTIIDPFPSLIPITIPQKALHRLQGIKWVCRVEAYADGTSRGHSSGELLFTRFGISGPAALDVSRAVNEALLMRKKVEIHLDLFPGTGRDELEEMLDLLWSDRKKSVAFSLTGIVKQRMPEYLCHAAGVDPEKRTAEISKKEKGDLVEVMKRLVLVPGEPRNFSEAVVAAGGVAVDEVNPGTMESRKIKGLYITGELLDIDGDSGGFNLQFAWSTGALAGMAAGS